MGPLHGTRIIEFAGQGPVPFAGMLLADLGADVVQVARPNARYGDQDPLNRNRSSITLDLKNARGIETARRLIDGAHVLIEGYRPGVMERLGLGPEVCHATNPRLIYGRMTGFGQDGPFAATAGHDINYIALAGALHNFRRTGASPTPPLNLVGDFGGGALFLVVGLLAAELHARTTGRGQVVDAAMTDGAASLLAQLCGMVNSGIWNDEPGTNIVDTGAPFYDVYRTSDNRYVAVGAIEPQFYSLLLQGIGLAEDGLPPQHDRDQWPVLKERFAAIFATKTRDEWAAQFGSSDACVVPVLSPQEAAQHPHIAHRSTYIEVGGVLQPAPAPRFSVTPCSSPRPPSQRGADTEAVLLDVSLTPQEIDSLRRAAIAGAPLGET